MSAVNGAFPANSSSIASPSTGPTGAKAQLKMSSGTKGVEAARKQAGSPLDGTQRKPASQKAWTQPINPITQRSTQNTSNGNLNASKASPVNHPSSPSSKETPTPNKHVHDRLMFLLANFMGLVVHFTLKNGDRYSGVFSGTSFDTAEMRYVFKMVKRAQISNEQRANGLVDTEEPYMGTGDNHVMTVDIHDVADLAAENVVLEKSQAKTQNGVSSSFMTDSDISRGVAFRERNLQPWNPGADTSIDLTLDESSKSGWDQFAANERLHGVKSTYDENIYTTKIDRSHPQYKERAARAEQIAKEIEASSVLNAHVAEERGQVVPEDNDVDEEEKYSGVRRELSRSSSTQGNKYMPPAKRAPTGQPTVRGAPVDPAIISSQLARPTMSTAAPNTESTSEKKEPTASELQKPETALPLPEKLTKAGKELDAKQSPSTQPPATTKPPQKIGVPIKSTGNTTVATARNATANVEHELLDQFKQFSAQEKLRLQERQRNIARHDKAIKLNDLKKFSQNFKLNTPVPDDLVPILAKDQIKQKEIVEKALRNVEEVKTTTTKSSPEQSNQKATPTKPTVTNAPINAQSDRHLSQRPRQGPGNYSNSPRNHALQNVQPPIPQRTGPGLLSQRLAITQQQHKAVNSHTGIPQTIPIQDMRMPPTGPSASSSGGHTPTSNASMRFNVKAIEFKPNPAANTFTPGGNPSSGSSPKPESLVKPVIKKNMVGFFDSNYRKTVDVSNSSLLDTSFNPIKRLIKEVQDENKSKEYTLNGGIPQAYRTPPTWDVDSLNKDKTSMEVFDRASINSHPISTPQTHPGSGPIPHQHQLPHHLQQGPPNIPQHPTPHHTPRHPPVQPHHGPAGPHHFEAHPMQYSASTSSINPSPRNAPQFMYNPNGPQTMPVYQQPIQAYGMSPSVHPVALRQPSGPQFVGPQGAAMGGQMMVNQPSSGPYMPVPMNHQMPMFTPAPAHMFAQHNGSLPPPPGPNGYPSPRPPGAQMMSHQGSQQGHPSQQQIIYMQAGAPHAPAMFTPMSQGPVTPMRVPYGTHQPHYQASPHQAHMFPQQHRTPSASYTQPMMQIHSMQPPAPLPSAPPHGPEGTEEVK